MEHLNITCSFGSFGLTVLVNAHHHRVDVNDMPFVFGAGNSRPSASKPGGRGRLDCFPITFIDPFCVPV